MIKLDADKYTEYKKKQREDKKQRQNLAKEKAGDFTASMHRAALCRSLKRVKGTIPKKETHKKVIVRTLFEDTVKLKTKSKNC